MLYKTLKKILITLNTTEYIMIKDIPIYNNKKTREYLQKLNNAKMIEIQEPSDTKSFIKQNYKNIRKRNLNRNVRRFYSLTKKGELVKRLITILEELTPNDEALHTKSFLKKENLQIITRKKKLKWKQMNK